MDVGRRRILAVVVLAAVAGVGVAHPNHVTVQPQVVDGAVVVESTDARQDGFVVVHRDDGGDPGAAIGHAPVEAGFRDDLAVPLSESIPAEATNLWVLLHGDDGDGTFEPGVDAPAETASGVAGDRVSVRGGDRSAFLSTTDGRAQPSDGSARLSAVGIDREGFLVVRADDGGPGRVIGVRALSPGVRCGLDVALNDSALPPPGGYATPWVGLYADDGDGEFDRRTDHPVRVGGDPIRTKLVLKVVENASSPDATGDGCLPGLSTADSTARTDRRSVLAWLAVGGAVLLAALGATWYRRAR